MEANLETQETQESQAEVLELNAVTQTEPVIEPVVEEITPAAPEVSVSDPAGLLNETVSAPTVEEQTALIQEAAANNPKNDPAGLTGLKTEEEVFAQAAFVSIHPFDFALLLEAAVTENPDLNVERTSGDIFILNGVSYEQTVEVPPSAEGQASFDKQVAEYHEQQRLQKRYSLSGLREELDALIARVTDLESRITDHNSRSGHKI